MPATSSRFDDQIAWLREHRPPPQKHHPSLFTTETVRAANGKKYLVRKPVTKTVRVWADVADGVMAVWPPSERLQRVSDAIAAALDAEVKRRSEMRDNQRIGQHKA